MNAPVSNHILYEQAKSQWIASHPNATAAEYTEAMRALAKRFGV